MTSAEVEALAQTIADELAADGWTVAPEELDGGFRIGFYHPLVDDFGAICRESDDVATLEKVARGVMGTHRIFALVRERPSFVEHAEAMRLVRSYAVTARWDEDDIRHVTYLLIALGALTEDEAEWVQRAGPSGPPV